MLRRRAVYCEFRCTPKYVLLKSTIFCGLCTTKRADESYNAIEDFHERMFQYQKHPKLCLL